MAIKSSNQITFTEHKKIIAIKEWYLATPDGKNVTTETTGWTTDIQTIDYAKKYLWNYEEVIYSIGSSDISEPVIIGVYGESGSSLQVKYISRATMPVIINNDVSAWSDTVPTQVDGQKIYMTQKLSTDTNWSAPIQISAVDGKTPTMTIIDGYWYVNGESTGVKAEGTSGDAPEITIGANGNWFIDGIDTGNKAQGEAGKDGSDIEYVYYRNTEDVTLSAPSYTNGILTSGWTVSPQGITEIYKYEYVSVRNKKPGEDWGEFSAPVIWSKWGEKGQDGDGVEYKYYLSNSNIAPTYSIGDNKWTDDPQGVSITQQYEYVVQIKTKGDTSTTSNPSLWAKFGEDGLGIISVKNYYLATTEPIFPSSPEWLEAVPTLSPTNKYLWNYEIISYTDGSTTETEQAIIGVYGDSGTDSVDFQIYSIDGFEFDTDLRSIELRTVVSKGGTIIESGATYQWKWWNKDTELYEEISGETNSSFVVNASSTYAFANIKCEMTYDSILYEDYVSLTEKTVVYTSVVKFFDGTNIFHDNDKFLIAYVELYQNNKKIDEGNSKADKYYSGIASVSSGVITSGITGTFIDGDTMYFVCEIDGLYNVVLGEYKSGSWNVVNYKKEYTYTNSIYPTIQSNIIAISKESINKSANIDFIIYKNGIEATRTSVNVIDSNDPIISSEQPKNAVHGQLWLDTSKSPHILYMYEKKDGSSTGIWVKCSEKIGGAVFTSKPDSYSKGDLWILGNNEVCGEFGPGSMLKSTTTSDIYNESHWIDADEESTELKNNIKQNFHFDSSTGLRIGQQDKKFYVNISSTEMGFYDNSENQKEKVVSISNNSAAIQSAKLKGNTEFYGQINICDPKSDPDDNVSDALFIWKVEQNGSFSLAVAT